MIAARLRDISTRTGVHDCSSEKRTTYEYAMDGKSPRRRPKWRMLLVHADTSRHSGTKTVATVLHITEIASLEQTARCLRQNVSSRNRLSSLTNFHSYTAISSKGKTDQHRSNMRELVIRCPVSSFSSRCGRRNLRWLWWKFVEAISPLILRNKPLYHGYECTAPQLRHIRTVTNVLQRRHVQSRDWWNHADSIGSR